MGSQLKQNELEILSREKLQKAPSRADAETEQLSRRDFAEKSKHSPRQTKTVKTQNFNLRYTTIYYINDEPSFVQVKDGPFAPHLRLLHKCK